MSDRKTSKPISILASLGLVACACTCLAACGTDVAGGAPAPAPTTPAAGPDGGPPAATTPRAMIDVPFLEGVATENRVVDPAMALDAGDTWFFTDLAGTGLPHVRKVALARSPAGQAAFFVPASSNTNGTALGAFFKIPAGSYTASVWFGSPATGAIAVTPVTLTFDQNGAGNPRAVELAPDAAPESTKDVDGVHWVKYTATVTPDLVAGWGYLYLEDAETTNDVYVAGPEILAVPKSNQIIAARGPRALRQTEAAFLRAARSRRQPRPLVPNADATVRRRTLHAR